MPGKPRNHTKFQKGKPENQWIKETGETKKQKFQKRETKKPMDQKKTGKTKKQEKI